MHMYLRETSQALLKIFNIDAKHEKEGVYMKGIKTHPRAWAWVSLRENCPQAIFNKQNSFKTYKSKMIELKET